VHPVGPYRTDISRCTVNKTVNIPASLFHTAVVSRKRAAYHKLYRLPHEIEYIFLPS